MRKKEIWEKVKDYESFYEISNLGRVKSIDRLVKNKNGYRKINSIILKQNIGTSGYYIINLLGKPKSIHKLVAINFLNHVPCGYKEVVDHIDNDKLNNNSSNLQLISNRENSIKNPRGKSKYVGIYFQKKHNKWISRILIDGIRYNLGSFEKEYDAHLAYKEKLKSITNKIK